MAGAINDTDSTAGFKEALEKAIVEVIRPDAGHVDAEGEFPSRGVKALADAGILGLASAQEVGGGGHSLRTVASVVERLAMECGSTAMVTLMHYAATAVIEAHGPQNIRSAIARGAHLTTLAFSEFGSRSHFWSPVGTARRGDDGDVRLDAQKSWVTSAGQADSYVWSSRPVSSEAAMTLWLVPANTPGLAVAGPFDGLGLRGNGSRPMSAENVRVTADAQMAGDGAGLDVALTTALPWFLVLNSAFCLGLAESAVEEARRHLSVTRLRHTGAVLRDAPVTRRDFARLRVRTDALRALLEDTHAARENERGDATLRVLEIKAFAGETAADVTDGAMQLCGGVAFRKELGLERTFRDSRAARVMAPTTDALYDFVGRLYTGMPLMDETNR